MERSDFCRQAERHHNWLLRMQQSRGSRAVAARQFSRLGDISSRLCACQVRQFGASCGFL